jgi:PAP2 superfamily
VNAVLLRRWGMSVGVTALLLWIASRTTFYASTILSPFLGVALLSIFLILLRTRRDLRELGLVALLTGAQYCLDVRLLSYPFKWPVLISFVGISGLATLAVRVIWASGTDRRTGYLTLIPAFLFVASEWFADYFLVWGERVRPKTLDLYLYSFDASLHIQPSFLMGQLFAKAHTFEAVSLLVYLALPAGIGLVFAGCVMQDRANAIPAVVSFLITGPVGACFYMMFPALGPVHIFLAKFPREPLTLDQVRHLFLEPIAVAGARNAMPSLHAAWIFLVFWYARKLSLLERIGAAAFVFFTLCATLGTGEHYFVDLVVAIPFTLTILGISQVISVRGGAAPWAAIGYGVGTTLVWFALLRYANQFFWASPFVPWLGCAGTLALGWHCARGLGGGATKTQKVEAEAVTA